MDEQVSECIGSKHTDRPESPRNKHLPSLSAVAANTGPHGVIQAAW